MPISLKLLALLRDFPLSIIRPNGGLYEKIRIFSTLAGICPLTPPHRHFCTQSLPGKEMFWKMQSLVIWIRAEVQTFDYPEIYICVSLTLRTLGIHHSFKKKFSCFYTKNHWNYGEEIAAKALIYAVLWREIPIIQWVLCISISPTPALFHSIRLLHRRSLQKSKVTYPPFFHIVRNREKHLSEYVTSSPIGWSEISYFYNSYKTWRLKFPLP